jgi:hypothetical protein
MPEFSARPFANVPVDNDAADLLDAVMTELERDPRAIAPVVGYDYDLQRIDAIFQVDVDHGLTDAADVASSAFDRALNAAEAPVSLVGVSVVEGIDPDQLP